MKLKSKIILYACAFILLFSGQIFSGTIEYFNSDGTAITAEQYQKEARTFESKYQTARKYWDYKKFIGAKADNCLWAVKTGESKVHLLGSLHVLKPDSYPLSDEIENVYKSSDTIIFETDMEAIQSPSVQAKFISLDIYKGTESLQKNISADTYEMLKKKWLKSVCLFLSLSALSLGSAR